MAKQGMKRPEDRRRKKNDAPPPRSLQEKAGEGSRLETAFFAPPNLFTPGQFPVPPVYPVIDTDLGRDNEENDLPAADRQDL